MNEMEIKKYLNEYFSYVKAVFLRDYSKYLTPEKVQKIQNMTDVFKIDSSSKFKVFITDKINICTDINYFIMDNNLDNDRDLKDISINGRIYVKYLIDNKDRPEKIILETVITHIIKYFVGKTSNIIEIGAIDLIVNDLVAKYNLRNVKPYESKEVEVTKKIKEIVSDTLLYEGVLNNNIDKIKKKYNEYVVEQIYLMDFDTLINETEKEYNPYYKRIGKVYYSDTLYDYENINYNAVLSELDRTNNYHTDDIDSKICRIKSGKICIQNLKEHMIMFDSHEQFLINNCLIEIDNIINKMNTSNIEEYYIKFRKMENELFPQTQKIWNNEITYPLSYVENDKFKFLIGEYPTSEYVETRLISDNQLMNIDCNIKNYGFLYRANSNIVYSSTRNFLYTKGQNADIEIDDQKDSKLLTPQLIINDNISSKNLKGKVLLQKALPCGIYVLCENILSSDYTKALELSKRYELPLIKLDKNYYKCEEKQEHQIIQEKTIEPIIETNSSKETNTDKKVISESKKPKLSFSDKIKKINKKIFYDEEIEEFKKVL